MLSVLRIQNLAIVDDLEVELGAGLNVLTGETGAGKSIVLQAISMLAGKRVNQDVIRHGAKSCEVDGLFRLSESIIDRLRDEVQEICGLFDEDDDALIIRRVVEAQGRGRAYINGKLVTVSVLQRVVSQLVDITGQHQQRSLLDVEQHRVLLDGFGVPDALSDSVRERFVEYSAAQKALDMFVKESGEREEHFRRLGFERDELKAAELRVGERQELEAESAKLCNVEALGQSVQDVVAVLDDDAHGVESLLNRVRSILHSSVAVDSDLREPYDLIDSAFQQVGEARLSLSHYAASLDADPLRLDFLRERIAEIARLERKYKKSESELVDYYNEISKQLGEFESGHFSKVHLQAKADEARQALSKVELELTSVRKDLACRLEKAVEIELHKLGMKKAHFEVRVALAHSSIHGADDVEFFLAANPGEPPRALAKVASGGELSRVLLVLKSVLNEVAGPCVQVFDEVDTGIGGAIAEIVGEKLKAVSKNTQVLVVTHAPQIAALGDRHLVVQKIASDNSTHVKVLHLSQSDRVDEIARMLAGKRVSERFHDSARELLGI